MVVVWVVVGVAVAVGVVVVVVVVVVVGVAVAIAVGVAVAVAVGVNNHHRKGECHGTLLGSRVPGPKWFRRTGQKADRVQGLVSRPRKKPTTYNGQ